MQYRTKLWVVAVAVAAGCGTVEAPDGVDAAPPAPADAKHEPPADARPTQDCSLQAKTVMDPNTGKTWNNVWFCRNDGGAPVYADASAGSGLVANMFTEWSWFVCQRRGQVHPGDGSDVWYYTQGDRAAPNAPPRHDWGYMPAANVRSSVHPALGVPEC